MSRRKQQAPCKVQDLPMPVSSIVKLEEQAGTQNGGSFENSYVGNQSSCESSHGMEGLDTSQTKENWTNGGVGDPLSLDEPLNLSTLRDLKTHDLLLDGDAEMKMDGDRFPSGEEELACPICHKTFMSKYGLLTHAEVHSTPELRCSICDLNFTSRSSFVSHQVEHSKSKPVDGSPSRDDVDAANESSVVFQKVKQISGFTDLSFIDFTCKKFSAISEDLCAKDLHRLTGRDCKYFFLCKSCDRLFPTLPSLKYHFRRQHFATNQTSNSQSSATEEADCGTSLPLVKMQTKQSETFEEVTKFLGLNSASSKNIDKDSSLVDAPTPPALPLQYSMDSSDVRTSPSLAFLKVPKWMRSSTADECYYDTEMSRDCCEERAPLKLKLVRRRVTGDEEKPVLVPSKYFIEDQAENVAEPSRWERTEGGDKEPKEKKTGKVSCDTCGEYFASSTALAGHKAASICGIGVGPSSNGRRMFWCRLCNYASCEKSTILRHQRTHTGLRPYSCKFCDIAFTTKANCERHIRKRHRVRVGSDVDVKNAVYCDYDLLRKARDGEINIPTTATVSNPGGKFFSFICRICKAAFSSRNSGARHVMSKHAIMNRKRASECINCVRIPNKKANQAAAKPQHGGQLKANFNNQRHVTLNGGRREKRRGEHNSAAFHAPNSIRGKVAIKAPKLIPLLKIRSHYENAMKVAEQFQDEYDKVFQALSDIRHDSGHLSAKLLSLIGSASLVLDPPPSSTNVTPFLPLRHDLDGASFLNDDDDMKQDDEEQSKDMPDFFPSSDLDRYDGYEASDNGDMLPSSSPESPFKPWKSTSSSLLLRHFAASSRKHSNTENEGEGSPGNRHFGEKENLSSMGQLVDFLKAPPLFSSSSKGSSFSTTETFAHMMKPISHNARFAALAPKPLMSSNDGDISKLSWPGMSMVPRLRDERGRYVRDPNSPYPKQPKMRSSPSSYPPLHDLPTMVPLHGGKVKEGKELLLSRNPQLKGRKCPKCDKVFPWASSLSRHIMTHTGLKPYMCARCSMRFTTRSNLLRHAYRRHGLERGSNQRHDVLVTLSVSEQKEHAEKEAQKMADMEEDQRLAEPIEGSADMEELQDGGGEVQQRMTEADEEVTSMKFGSKPLDREVGRYNKRYLCGMCRLPFANRSNLVRHLHRLHRITKDDPEFRGLLVKILPSLKVKFNRHSAALPSIKSASVHEVAGPEKLEPSPHSPSPPAALLNGENGEQDSGVSKVKPFTCSICSIGFTKRNNAARHIQHQHNVSRKSAHFHQLIIRNHQEDVKDVACKEEADAPLSLAAFADDFQASGSSKSSHAESEISGPIKVEVGLDGKDVAGLVMDGDATPDPLCGEAQSAWKENKEATPWKKVEEVNNSEFSEKPSGPRANRKKDIRLTHFICGVCKRIFKEVVDLKVHLDEHNIPHPWHCSICGVPFTNKYNCQRHLMRRHGVADVEPKYVEDLRHGPRIPRKRSKGHGRARNLQK